MADIVRRGGGGGGGGGGVNAPPNPYHLYRGFKGGISPPPSENGFAPLSFSQFSLEKLWLQPTIPLYFSKHWFAPPENVS